MKKVLSKILIATLIIIFITEFVFANAVFAIDGVEVINSISNIMGGVVSIVFWPKRIIVTAVAFLANQAIKLLAEMDNSSELEGTLLTPFHIFFNECQILDVNFFKIDGLDTGSVTYKIRTRVAKWFSVMRLLASAILLVILIYVGIRMALASVAEEKSKYKKMFFDWLCSLALIYVLHFIAIFVIYANNAIVEALKSIADQQIAAEAQTKINEAIGDMGVKAVTGIGIDSMTSVIVYALLIFQIIGYLLAYMSRMIKVGFLLIISPLISITYSIDKMGDGKSQALNNWLKEFIYTVLIQPFHCVIYITFISIAFSLINTNSTGGLAGAITATKEYNQLANAVLAVLCIKFIKDAEEMVRKIFGFKDNNKDTSLAAGLAVAAVAANKAGSVGKTARGVAGKFKNNNMFKAALTDIKGLKFFGKIAQKASDLKQKFQESGAGKALKAGKEAAVKVKNNVKKASDKFRKFADNNKAIKGFKKGLEKGKKFWNSKPVQFMRGRNSLSSALGIAAGLAHYAATDSSPFSSIAAGNAAYQSADAFLTSSAATIGAQNADLIDLREQDRAEELKEVNEDKEELEKERNEAITNLEETENNLEEVNEDLEEAQNDLEEIDNESEDDGDGNTTDNNENTNSEREQRRASALNRVESLTKQRESLIEQRDKTISKIDTLENDIRVKEQELERINYDMNSTNSSSGMEGYIERIQRDGARGDFDKSKSKRYSRIEDDLRVALNTAERDASFDILADRIARQVAADPKDFDMDSIIRSCLGDEVMSDSKNYQKILSAMRNLKNFECESQIYNKTKFSNDMNVSTSKIAEKTFDSYKK